MSYLKQDRAVAMEQWQLQVCRCQYRLDYPVLPRGVADCQDAYADDCQ